MRNTILALVSYIRNIFKSRKLEEAEENAKWEAELSNKTCAQLQAEIAEAKAKIQAMRTLLLTVF
jgi:hypothetical protein